ncbi:hypothetical protein BS50DRAFT_567606 [Corynespora cassiicola Philippines]|uniref:Uncharacterized protein n=1 Tax=Corynespora cassiicola Philippines TaxID=1448308 RepID=A0A2T2PB07_CORCC|nr:hypothetical protein BS50DRAFT_567606 [Corynespora cassiicola Philippines]
MRAFYRVHIRPGDRVWATKPHLRPGASFTEETTGFANAHQEEHNKKHRQLFDTRDRKLDFVPETGQ